MSQHKKNVHMVSNLVLFIRCTLIGHLTLQYVSLSYLTVFEIYAVIQEARQKRVSEQLRTSCADHLGTGFPNYLGSPLADK